MSGFVLDLASLQSKLGDQRYLAAQKTMLLQRVRPGFEISAAGSDHWVLQGDVESDGSALYAVTVSAEIDEAGQVHHLGGRCECAEPFPCRHAAALLIKAAHAKSAALVLPATVLAGPNPRPPATPEEDQAISEWLDLFESEGTSSAGAQEAEAEGGDQLVFVLGARRQGHRDMLEIKCQWAKPLKRGGWGKPRDVGLIDASAQGRDVGEVIRLIQAMQRSNNAFNYHGGSHRGWLSGPTGELALRLACDSGRLFLLNEAEELHGPLLRGSDESLAWAWKNTPEQPRIWRLSAQVHGRPHSSIWPVEAMVWLDPSALQWGRVDAQDISMPRLKALLDLPPVAESAWFRHEAALMRQLAGLPIPPIAEPPLELRGTRPKGILRIVPSNAFERPSLGLASATLLFDYRNALPADHPDADLRQQLLGHWAGDNAAVLLSKPSTAAMGSKLEGSPRSTRILLFRDLGQERRWKQALADLGLQADRTGRFRCPSGLAPQDQPWLAWADEGFAAFADLDLEIDASAMQDWVAQAQSLSAQLLAPTEDDSSLSPWFDLSLGIQVGELRVNVLPVLPSLLAALQRATVPPFVHVPHPEAPDSRWLRVPSAALVPWVRTLMELLHVRSDASLAKSQTLRISQFELLRAGADLGAGLTWAGAERMRDLLERLQAHKRDGGALPTVRPPEGLTAELRPYQQQGLNWLQFLRRHDLGGILADDMGLGKTLQTLAHILVEKEAGSLTDPALIVCPVSVLGNWRREAARFAPTLRVQVVHGLDRHGIDTQAQDLDVVVAPYSLLQRDRERWLKRRWSVLVLDEAQHIKNASTLAARVAQDIAAAQRLCLSGTPLENHLGELWSLFHFVMPGFLGSAAQFKTHFRSPIELRGDEDALERLRKRVTPFILRRTKSNVAIELPPKVETVQTVTLQGKQADLYETIRLSTEQSVRDALAEKGLARSQIQVLDALLKLRQVCCDPRLVPSQRSKSAQGSAKLERLMELLPELIEEGRKVLLFSQFTSMLSLIEQALAAHGGISWVKLTGESTHREALIERFTSGEVPLFLISLKAGGTGLNLQAADTVIHYDPWWNPAAENQATDRAHRIGQTQQVMVYKLVAEGTIEERMLELQSRKAALAQGVLEGSHQRRDALFTENDLQELLKPLGA